MNDRKERLKDLASIIGLELISPALGAGIASLGRSIGHKEIVAVLPAMDLFWGSSYATPRGLWEWTKYSLGVAAVYSDKLYPVIQEYFNKK